MSVFLLRSEIAFPHPYLADKDGLLAIGGDFLPERLLLAYKNGIFPWFEDEENSIYWFATNPRFVLFPPKLKIRKSVQKEIDKAFFQVTEDTCFEEVISRCAKMKRKGENGTWISPKFIQAYQSLHDLGYAKSIEIWQNKELVGGLYGIELNGCFFGESVFHTKNNAGNLAIYSLCKNHDYQLIDCQMYTKHFASIGAEMIPLEVFLKIIGSPNYKKTTQVIT